MLVEPSPDERELHPQELDERLADVEEPYTDLAALHTAALGVGVAGLLPPADETSTFVVEHGPSAAFSTLPPT